MKRLLLLLFFIAHTALGAEELRLVLERKSLTATWRTYRQFVDGVEILGTAVVQRVDADGTVHEVARDIANLHGGQALMPVPREDRQECLSSMETCVYVNVGGEGRLMPRPRGPMIWNAKARVFDPNPVAKLNDPSLRDHNNAASAVPESAYSIVELPDLAPSGMLSGPNVRIVDTDAPFTEHADASQPLLFDRSQPQFEEVNAYFHIDASQRYLQSLGYAGERRVVAYAIPVDAHAVGGSDNSFYAGGNADGRGQIYFGDGGTDDAEDSDVIMHEYAHAIQDWIAPGAFGGALASQSRAMAEGFGFYWAFSSSYAQTTASGRDPFCIADWDARCFGDDSGQQCGYPDGADCLRRVDSPKTMADYVTAELPGTEHANGEIWASALREIFLAFTKQHGVEQGKRMIDSDVIEGTFGVAPSPTFNGMARKLLEADRALWGGMHGAAICTAMTSRGILAAGECGVLPRGELTVIESGARGAALPASATVTVNDTRPVDKLTVRVDVETPSRGKLQITLTAPDGTTRTLLAPSLDKVADVHAAFDAGISGKPIAGTWTLTVSGGTGRLLDFALIAKFSGDEPLAARPISSQRQIIPVIAHTTGVGGTAWRSDLFLFGRGAVTLVYTPSGADGTTTFGAVNVIVPPGQVVAFRDVVEQLFGQGGSGTLEIQGDVQAWSATYDAVARIGQSIEPVRGSDAGPGPIYVQRAARDGRTNIGIVETAGASGTATVTAGPVAVAPFFVRTVPLLPFTHVQFALPLLPGVAEVRASGGARIVAYTSTVGSDAVYVPSRELAGARMEVIPVAAFAPGAFGTTWQTDLWIERSFTSTGSAPATVRYGSSGFTVPPDRTYFENVVGTLTGFTPSAGQLELNLPPDTLAATFLYSAPARRGDTILAAEPLAGSGDAIRVENDAAFRTNIGISEVAGAPVTVRVTVFDAAGNALSSRDVDVPARGVVQDALGVPVVDGRVHFEVIAGSGKIVGYASVVDNASQDAYFVRAR
jgi:hypothetical protein